MSFDLNIQNYKIHELEDIFNLPNNFNYDQFIIERKEEILRKNILSDRTIGEDTRQNTLKFLNNVKMVLVSNKNNANNKSGNRSSDRSGDIIIRNSITNSAKKSETDNNNIEPYLIGSTPLVTTLSSNLYDSKVIVESGSVPIIDKTFAQGAYPYTASSEYFAGKLNPLTKRTILQKLTIDTRFRDNYLTSTSSNFQFEIPYNFENVMSIQLDSIEIPFDLYNISASMGNNFFTIGLNTGQHYTIILESGIYTNPQMIASVNLAMAAIPELNDASTYLITMSTDIGDRSIFTNTSASGYEFTLNFQASIAGTEGSGVALQLKLGWIFGFRLGIYTNKSKFTSEGCLDSFGTRYIFLVFDDYNNSVNNNFFSAFNSSVLNKNILARISLQGINTVVQNLLSITSTPRQYFGPVDIRKLHIQLLDEFGRIVDMSNMDFSFSVSFTVVYDL